MDNVGGKFAQPIIEEVYNLEDALVAAGFLMSFMRHADVVKIANLAQLVNVIAPLLTKQDALLKQSLFYAFRMLSSRKGGTSLQTAVDGPSYATELYGEVSYLDRAVTLDDGKLNLFLTNRSCNDALNLKLSTDFGIESVASAEILHHEDPKAANSFDEPNVVVAEAFTDIEVGENGVSLTLPPLSLVAATLTIA